MMQGSGNRELGMQHNLPLQSVSVIRRIHLIIRSTESVTDAANYPCQLPISRFRHPG